MDKKAQVETKGVEVIKNEEVEVQIEEEVPLTEEESENLNLITKQILDPELGYGVSESIIQNVDKDEVIELSQLSKALEVPLTMMSENGDDATQSVAKSLMDLRENITDVIPENNQLEETFFSGILSKITGSTPIKRYLTKFQTANDVIEAIGDALNRGGIRLRELNAIYFEDKERYRKVTKSLSSKLRVLEALEGKIIEEIDLLSDNKAEYKSFLETEVAFPLAVKIQDTHSLLGVTAQGVLSLDVLIKNNRELINSTKRTQTLTISALRIGALVAAGLAEEGKVLDAVNKTNQITGDMIENNGKMLKERGVGIHKRATEAMVSLDQLSNAFKDTLGAIQDIETYKVQALPKMRESAARFREMNNSIEASIKKIERGEKTTNFIQNN